MKKYSQSDQRSGESFMTDKLLSRRKFLALAGLGTGLGVAACAQNASVVPPVVSTLVPTSEHAEITMPPAQGGGEDMDALHKAGIDIFVANAGKDTTFWRQPMAFTLDGSVKVFELTCTEGPWETEPGKPVAAMLYNGLVPGPEIRV